MICIDGSVGEGGGQVLRTALTLSLMTGQPMTIKNIRAGRKQPGLMPQHLKAAEAATEICNGRINGCQLKSQYIEFIPSRIRSGEFQFDIGTAGSTSLLLQTIFLPLTKAKQPSSVTLIGGTHVPFSPSFHYIDRHWLVYMKRIGFDAQLTLELAGFYPQGGGRIRAYINPAEKLDPIRLLSRGALKSIRGLSLVANLALGVAEQQRQHVLKRIGGSVGDIEIDVGEMSSPSSGAFLLLEARFQNTTCIFSSLGVNSESATRVATDRAKRAAVEAVRLTSQRVCHNPATKQERPPLQVAVSA